MESKGPGTDAHPGRCGVCAAMPLYAYVHTSLSDGEAGGMDVCVVEGEGECTRSLGVTARVSATRAILPLAGTVSGMHILPV
jgi:hypothetical protein